MDVPLLLVVDSHPVQYRVPVYREMARILSSNGMRLLVIYGSDSSLRGAMDAGFGQSVAWDEPMLDGYESEFLPGAGACGPGSFSSVDGRGVGQRIRELRPAAVLLNGINYRLYTRAMFAAFRSGTPLWLRSETQDEAFTRSRWKTLLRQAVYRAAYLQFSRFFAIGEINAFHYRAHGVPESKLSFARYCVVDRFAGTAAEREARGKQQRGKLGVHDDATLVMFSGKLIEKKNPAVLFDALERLSPAERGKFALLLVGSGELEAALRARAARMPDVRVIFTGFVNQAEIGDYYLACDGFVLPSRQMGETWGLVANEALMAGKPVILSRHAGSSRDFAALRGVHVIDPSAGEIATGLKLLPTLATGEEVRSQMSAYSVEAAAQAMAEQFLKTMGREGARQLRP